MNVELRWIPGRARIADAHAVRRTVFIEEQDVSEAEEMDGRDGEATHVVAYADTDQAESDQSDGKGRPVGTARLRVLESGVAKLERVAVLESHRGEGVGERLMQAVEDKARQRGCTRARLHGQTTVEGFYRRLGYQTVSDVFQEAEIPHVEMEKRL